MNQASESTISEVTNPWKCRSDLPKPNRGSVAMAAVLFFAACAAIPFAIFNEDAAILLWALLVAAGFFFTRSARGLTGLTIGASLLGAILPGVFLPVETLYYPAVGAIVAAMCVGVCAGAYFQTVTRLFWVLPALSILSAVGAYLVTGQWLMAVMSLALLPAVVALSVATDMGEGCTTAICYCIGGLLVSAVGLILLWLWQTYGALNGDLLRALPTQWKETFVEAQIRSRGALIAMIDEQIATGEGMTEDLIARYETVKQSLLSFMSDEVIRDSIEALFRILPAILCLGCSIPAFLSQRMLNAAYITNGMAGVVTPEAEFFTMSLPSAVIYAVSLFLYMVPVKGMDFVAMVAGNLTLILLPGMLVLALRYFKQQFGAKRGRSRRWIIFLVIAMLLVATSGFLLLGGFFGAYMRIMQAIQKSIKKKMGQG